MAIASLALAIGLSACKSNGSTPAAPANGGMAAPVTATWQPADKTTEFLKAFRPQE
ncbi:hypothetical protein [Variovorax sp. PBS-H4]|uniref:hypothetical protein n=1 Tax=Variovorax sp. PBS-H4 TaxID=434008 RepID=UPI0013A55E24|nr:hypothetical protein [Variovorax sp. PBS-H4]